MKPKSTSMSLIAVLAVGVGIGFALSSSIQQAPAAQAGVSHEYRVESVAVAAPNQYEKVLRKYGRSGWRLVEVDGPHLFFERAP